MDNDEMLDFGQIFGLIRTYWKMTFFLLILSVGAAAGLYKVVPPRFKATSLLNLKNSYFQNALINDIVAGGGGAEGGDAAQKEALFRLALSDEFIGELGTRYNLLKTSPTDPNRSTELEVLRKRIDYFATNSSTFQISATGETAQLAYNLTNDTLNHVIDVLISERRKNILQYRDSLKKNMETLGVKEEAAPASRNERLQAEMNVLQAKIAAAKAKYSPEHPTVIALNEKAEALRQAMKSGAGPGAKDEEGKPVHRETNGKTDLYYELLKKINYIDVVLGLEQNKADVPYLEIIARPTVPNHAVFPVAKNFGLGGVLVGLLLSGMLIGVRELKVSGNLTPDAAAKMLGTTFLGSLPRHGAENVIQTSASSRPGRA